MPAIIKASEIRPLDPVRIDFGFTGLSEKHAADILRDLFRTGVPRQRRPKQCVYSIRLLGAVAVAYPKRFSPLLYVGEGSAASRFNAHSKWLAPLVRSVQGLGVEVQIIEVARRNHDSLYQHVEADLLRWFAARHGTLPWFNQQHEPSKAEAYEYRPEAKAVLRRMIGVGSGKTYLWAIKPTKNNEMHKQFRKIGTSPSAM